MPDALIWFHVLVSRLGRDRGDLGGGNGSPIQGNVVNQRSGRRLIGERVGNRNVVDRGGTDCPSIAENRLALAVKNGEFRRTGGGR
jgi:hypothetical protein